MRRCGESAERGLRFGAMGRDTYRRLGGGVYRGLSLVVLAGCLGGMGTSAALERVVHRIPSVVGRPARAGEGTGRFCPLRFSKPRIYHVAGGVANITVADLGNGDPDIVVTNATGGPLNEGVQVFYGTGDGRIGPIRSYRVRGGPYALAVADLGNGHPDIVVTQDSKNTVTVLYGVGGGRIGKIRSYPVGRGPDRVVVADLGNGHPDIVVANSGGHTVSVLYGVGGGRIGPIRSYRVGRQPFYLAVADLGNGHPDIVVANSRGHTVSVLYGVGGGRIGPIRSYRVGNLPFYLAVADLGNGHPDIVVVNTHTVSVLYGVGGGRIGPIRSYPVQDPTSLAVADLGNGHPDIVMRGKHVVSVLYGVGGGRFAPSVVYPVPGRWASDVKVADLGNGHPDVVMGEGSKVSVLYGIGGGRFAPPVLYPAGKEGMYPMVVADLGNGHPDIIGVHRFQGTMSILYGEGEERECAGHPLPAVPKQIHHVYLKDHRSGSLRHARNFFVEDIALTVGISLPNMTASALVKWLSMRYQVNPAMAIADEESGKYLVIAGETAAELGQVQGHVLVLLDGMKPGGSPAWRGDRIQSPVPYGASISDSTNPNNTATFYNQPISFAFKGKVASSIEYFAIPIPGGG